MEKSGGTARLTTAAPFGWTAAGQLGYGETGWH
jgi:hypothetical protein